MTTAYEMCIKNVARYIRLQDIERDRYVMTAFDAGAVLGVAFCKDPNEVVADLVRANVNEEG